jgi:hypothetical protein
VSNEIKEIKKEKVFNIEILNKSEKSILFLREIKESMSKKEIEIIYKKYFKSKGDIEYKESNLKRVIERNIFYRNNKVRKEVLENNKNSLIKDLEVLNLDYNKIIENLKFLNRSNLKNGNYRNIDNLKNFI